jgi:hypothetical protein
MPTVEDVTNLWRAIINDSFTGVGGQPGSGRIATDSAAFTLPYLNSAFRTLQRKLRTEGVTFPIKDNVILNNLTPVVNVDSNVQVFVGYNGYFDGTTMHATPQLPSDLLQPYLVWEQTVGTGFPFQPMAQPQEGLPSVIQGPYFGMWEWRNYGIYMVGSTQIKNLRLRYQSGQPPINVPAADFATTAINIIDSTDALALDMALQFGGARGANPQILASIAQRRDEAISDMAAEYVRRSQTVSYRRAAYGEGGSNDGGNGALGQSGFGA